MVGVYIGPSDINEDHIGDLLDVEIFNDIFYSIEYNEKSLWYNKDYTVCGIVSGIVLIHKSKVDLL